MLRLLCMSTPFDALVVKWLTTQWVYRGDSIYYAPAQGALSDDDAVLTSVCLTSVAYIRAACAAGRLDGECAVGRPGSRLPLRASVAGLGGGTWRPPAYSLFFSSFYWYGPRLFFILETRIHVITDYTSVNDASEVISFALSARRSILP